MGVPGGEFEWLEWFESCGEWSSSWLLWSLSIARELDLVVRVDSWSSSCLPRESPKNDFLELIPVLVVLLLL